MKTAQRESDPKRRNLRSSVKAGDWFLILCASAIAYFGVSAFQPLSVSAQTVELARVDPEGNIYLSAELSDSQKRDLLDFVIWKRLLDDGKISREQFIQRMRSRVERRQQKNNLRKSAQSADLVFQL